MAEHLEAIVEWKRNWFASLSEDEKAALTADQAASMEDPVKSERMAEAMATFQAADTNQDGVLSMEEFFDFQDKAKQNFAARGVPLEGRDGVPEDMQRKTYEYMLSMSGEGATGVTLAGFGTAIGAIAQAMSP